MSGSDLQGSDAVNDFQGFASEILFFSNQKVDHFNLNSSETDLLSSLALTETINSSNVIHLSSNGYSESSTIFAGGFNTSSTSSQVIYESGGNGTGTALRIDEIAGQLTFVVSAGRHNNIDISSAIAVDTDYVYIVENYRSK